MISEALIQSGKSLREERDALSYVDRVKSQAEISEKDYIEVMKHKRVAVLTRQFNIENLKDNDIYQTDLCEKIIYPSKSELLDNEKEMISSKFNISVRTVSSDVRDPFSLIVSDLKKEPLPNKNKVPNFISIECGPTVTGPLYQLDSMIRPVDMLFLTRYLGPVRPDALGPRFCSVSEISKNYSLMSTYKENAPQIKGKWIFEQWDKKIKV